MQALYAARVRAVVVGMTVICLGWANIARAYIDLAPTLARIIADSKKIVLAEVVEWNSEKQILVLKEIRSLKGDLSTELVRHELAATASLAIPRQIRVWAAPGARCVLFSSRNTTLVCV